MYNDGKENRITHTIQIPKWLAVLCYVDLIQEQIYYTFQNRHGNCHVDRSMCQCSRYRIS